MVVLLFLVSVCANEKFLTRARAVKAAPCILLIGGIYCNSSPLIASEGGFNSNLLPYRVYQSEFFPALVILIVVLIISIFRAVKIRKIEAGPLVSRL